MAFSPGLTVKVSSLTVSPATFGSERVSFAAQGDGLEIATCAEDGPDDLDRLLARLNGQSVQFNRKPRNLWIGESEFRGPGRRVGNRDLRRGWAGGSELDAGLIRYQRTRIRKVTRHGWRLQSCRSGSASAGNGHARRS